MLQYLRIAQVPDFVFRTATNLSKNNNKIATNRAPRCGWGDIRAFADDGRCPSLMVEHRAAAFSLVFSTLLSA
jgi:hypothetical protein